MATTTRKPSSKSSTKGQFFPWRMYIHFLYNKVWTRCSEPLKHSIVKRILLFRRQIQAYFYPLIIFHLFGISQLKIIGFKTYLFENFDQEKGRPKILGDRFLGQESVKNRQLYHFLDVRKSQERQESNSFYNKCSKNSRSQIVFRTDIF